MRITVPSVSILVISALCALVFNGALHELIPHTHGNDQSVTQSMHASLSHDKLPLGLFGIIIALCAVLRTIPARVRPSPCSERERMLMRGIEKYRRFR